MKHEKGFWPMAREFGCADLDDEPDAEAPACQRCDGTGTEGFGAAAKQGRRCGGRGAVRPASLERVAGHA